LDRKGSHDALADLQYRRAHFGMDGEQTAQRISLVNAQMKLRCGAVVDGPHVGGSRPPGPFGFRSRGTVGSDGGKVLLQKQKAILHAHLFGNVSRTGRFEGNAGIGDDVVDVFAHLLHVAAGTDPRHVPADEMLEVVLQHLVEGAYVPAMSSASLNRSGGTQPGDITSTSISIFWSGR
jgi:hypothetical protein